MATASALWFICNAAVVLVVSVSGAVPYYGTRIGSINKHAHDVEGDVYAVDDKTVYIRGFSYDGQGPDAFFWGGTTDKPDSSGFIIPDEKGKKSPLEEYRNRNVLLRLPPGKTLRNIKWISVWCRKFNANFGDIFIPENLLIPQPSEIGRIPTKEHGVSSGPVMVVDTQTLLVPEFTYDGLGPAAYWWVSRGAKQHPRGTKLADENGSLGALPRYTGKTVVITLPDDKTIYDYDWFGVWCDEARVDFGSVQFPQNVIVPPSPRMLGVELEYKLNCEVLHDEVGFEIRWIMDGEDIVLQMVAKLESNEYMSFGLSKNDSHSIMINADAIVTWIDRHNRGHAVDYFLGSKEQCTGRRGSCPDVRYSDGDDSVTLLNAANVNGYTMITFKRPQVGLDEKYDQHIYSDGPQAIVWAIGPLNNRDEVSYHGKLRSEGDVFIDFARPPQWNCPQPEDPKPTTTSRPTTTTTTTTQRTTTTRKTTRKQTATTSQRKPKPTSSPSGRRRNQVASASRTSSRVAQSSATKGWKIQQIVCPSDRTIRAQIGPAGGKKGYQSITGDVGWGIAWYMNGLLIPEITVQRGKTYTFIVEGGIDPDNSARQHPLYITDDPEGGYEHKSQAEKKKTKLYGGVTRDRTGNYSPTAAGRMCEHKLLEGESADDFETFEDFQQNLELKCDRGKAGKLVFKPDANTPDLVYYQCYTHRYLGWKIHVVDSCDSVLDTGASQTHVKNVTVNGVQEKYESDYKRGSSKQNFPYESSQYYPRESVGNDGIPLEFYEQEFPENAEEEEIEYATRLPVTIPTTEKQLYYRPSTKSPHMTTKKQYYYQYDRPTTQYQYKYYKTHYSTTTTTPAPSRYTKKSEYVNYPLTSPPERKRQQYTSSRSYASPVTTPRPRVYLQTGVPDAIKLYSYESPASQESVYHSKSHPVIYSSPKASSIRVTIYPGTSPSPSKPTTPPQKVTTRSQIPWWKPYGDQVPAAKRPQTSRVHPAVYQGESSIISAKSTRPPVTISYHNGFLPIVIKSNGSFDRALVDFPPPDDSYYYNTRGKKGSEAKKHVHVLVRQDNKRVPAIRRANGNNKGTYIKTSLGKFRLPSSDPRRKSALGQSSEEINGAFLPLLLPKNQVNGTSAIQKSSLPVIPIVVPQKKGDNVYVLHHVLSLIPDSPAKSRGDVFKTSQTVKSQRTLTRKVRSPDHHKDHSHHDHMDHMDHRNMNHKSDKKESPNSASSILPVLSLIFPCLFLLFT